MAAKLTEGEERDELTEVPLSSPSVAYGATSPWRGRIKSHPNNKR